MQVVSPDPVSLDQCKLAAKKAMDAWKFDLDVMHWSHPEEMQGVMRLRLLADSRVASGTRAYADGDGKRFSVRISLVGDSSLDVTMAHELGHIQAFRALKEAKYPVRDYFLEGHGLILNALYAEHIGDIRRGNARRDQAQTVMSMTADEAHTILTNQEFTETGTADERSQKNFRMERLGMYFVEYLRVRENFPDAVPMMGRVFELMGDGKGYGQAFAQVYGVTAGHVAEEIVDLFQRTQASPADRVRGTLFEPYLSTERGVETKKQ